MAQQTQGELTQILIVDDDDEHYHRLEREFFALACRLVHERSARTAAAAIARSCPDLIVIEPVIAGRSWFHLLVALRAASRQTPWVVATAFPSSSLAVEATRLGAVDVLVKPTTAAELAAVFRGERVQNHHVPTDLSLARFEWEHINRVLRLCNGNVTAAARVLRIPRQTIYNKMKKVPHSLQNGE